MATRSSRYWAKRAEQVMLEAERNTNAYLNELNALYRRTADGIDERIRRIFRTYQRGFTAEEAKAWLAEEIPRRQYEALKEALAAMTDDRLREQTLMRLNAPAYRYRITRLQYIRQSIMAELSKAADAEKRISTECYTSTLQNAYTHTMFEIQKGAEVSFDFAQLPQSTVDRLLSARWYGRNFSASIWRNRGVVAKAAGDVVKQGVLSGQSIREMSKALMEHTYTHSMKNATRLIRTEVNYFCNQGELESYKEAGIEEYEFLATLDLRTSQICREHDGKRYRVESAVIGENCPPLHPYCRSTTVAVIEAPNLDRMNRRAARDENGKTVNIENISYPEWRNRFTKGVGSGIINTGADGMFVDIEIDRFTPCLVEVATGKIVQTTYSKASKSEFAGLKKQGWLFDWNAKGLSGDDIYKLTLSGSKEIQGLVALRYEERSRAVYVHIAESAPHNRGTNKRYEGVGGHLFAIAAKISLDKGYDGYFFLDAKNQDLVKHYAGILDAQWIGIPHPYRMVVNENAAAKLLNRYTLEKE